MNILKDIIESLQTDFPVKKIRRGTLWTGVVTRHCGLASALHEGGCEDGDAPGQKDTRAYEGQSAGELTGRALSDLIEEASLGLAAINSLLEPQHDNEDINAAEFILKAGKGKNVSVVGHFPFVDRIRECAENLWVIEKRPRPGDVCAEESGTYLPQSDVVVITSTSLINHTIDSLVQLCPKESIKVLLGPSTPMARIFFDYGFDVISGSMVTDVSTVMDNIAKGISFSRMKKAGGIRLLNLIRDPGVYRNIMAS